MKGPEEACEDACSQSEPVTEEANPDSERGVETLEEIERVQEERDRFEEQVIRLRAEFDNFRRRTRREADDMKDRAASELVVALLPIVDNLERALGATHDGSGASKTLVDGVEMVLKQFLNELEKVGVLPIEATGRPFDPTRHEAVLHEETDEHPDSHVIAELQRGYVMHDKVLRPSMVKVAKGQAIKEEL